MYCRASILEPYDCFFELPQMVILRSCVAYPNRRPPSPPTHHFAGPGGIQISTAAWKSSGWNSENGWFVNGISFFQRGHFFTFPSWVNHPFFNWKFLELGGKIRWQTLLPCLFLFWGPCFTVVPFLGRFARHIQGWRCICRAECHAYQLCAVA